MPALRGLFLYFKVFYFIEILFIYPRGAVLFRWHSLYKQTVVINGE